MLEVILITLGLAAFIGISLVAIFRGFFKRRDSSEAGRKGAKPEERGAGDGSHSPEGVDHARGATPGRNPNEELPGRTYPYGSGSSAIGAGSVIRRRKQDNDSPPSPSL